MYSIYLFMLCVHTYTASLESISRSTIVRNEKLRAAKIARSQDYAQPTLRMRKAKILLRRGTQQGAPSERSAHRIETAAKNAPNQVCA